MTRSILLLSTAILAGCASNPASLGNLAGPSVEIFAVAPTAPDAWAANGVTGIAPKGDWLTQFNDSVMERLVHEALENSPTIESRLALVRASEAFTRVARAGRRPNVNGSIGAGGISTATEFNGDIDRSTDESYTLSLDASWEIDLWNRLGAGVAEAEANLVASQADLAAAELSIAAQTATAWVNLNAALAQQRVALQTYEARDRVRILTERRFQRGLTQALDVRTARSSLASAEASIAAREQASSEAARRLEVLLGRYPAAEIEAPAELPTLDAVVPQGNPALLLSRRPDIASAEANVVAAGLAAEQARLAMLPSLSLTGSVSNRSSDFADVFDPERIAAQLIGSLVQPIFNGGRLDAQRDAAVAQAESAVANYANAALTAWQEVEDTLAADDSLARQEDAQMRALEEARLAEDLAERQYTSGTINIFGLIDAQTQRLNAESQYVAARANRATNRIAYHLALGGGLPDRIVSANPSSGSVNAAYAAVGE